MSLRFIGGERTVWAAIRSEVKSSRRADVAVAYFGQGGSRQLPLPAGSRLVVDASEKTVRAGGTCPAELLKLVKRKVDVYTKPDMHAKVYVFPRSAFVGSANASSPSANRLCEAVIRTTDADVVRRAREFVVAMCEDVPLGPEALRALQRIYRPPRVLGGGRAGCSRRRRRRVFFERFDEDDYPVGSEDFVEELLEEAREKRERRRGFELCETWRSGPPRYSEGDIMVMASGSGPTEMVSPPGRVIHVRRWSNGQSKMTFAVVELPQARQVSLRRLTKLLGYGWKRRLARRGRLKRESATALLAWWAERM